MLDSAALPWLLEVNCDPALGTDSPLDLRLKSRMLIDLLNVVGMPLPPTPPAAPSSDFDLWAAGRGEAAADGGAAGERERALRDEWTVASVDAEYWRSLRTMWRRLCPCANAEAKYGRFFEDGRTRHRLPFAVDERADAGDPPR